MRTHLLAVLLCGALATTTWTQNLVNASGGELIPEQAAFDVQHYDLVLAVDPEQRTIDGTLTMRALGTASSERIGLDLANQLDVSAVTVNGAEVPWKHNSGMIWITTEVTDGQELEVVVEYGGKPRRAPRPPWDGGFTWSKTKSGKPWIATSCQGEGADLWWPCKDHPSDKPDAGFDLHFTVPEGLFVASNGRLVGETKNDDGTRTFDWRVSTPIANYTVAFNAAPYEKIEKEFEGVAGSYPVVFYHLPESAEPAAELFEEILDHLRFFEEFCGPYPFRADKYGIVETPHLGMEHQTIIAYGNKFRKAKPDYDWLHHHEAAHEWWANLVTCRDWKDMWIHEGIGTYMQALYLESRFGPEAYRKEMASKRAGIQNQRAVAPRETKDSKQIYFGAGGRPDNDIYFKGSWVVHTLRWVLGDETFFEVLRRWAYPDPALEKTTDGSAVRFSDTDELLRIAEEVSGRELDWYFDVYLRQPALPQLSGEAEGGELVLRWELPAGIEEFPMPVPVAIGGETVRVETADGVGRVALPAGAEWELDPDRWVLKR